MKLKLFLGFLTFHLAAPFLILRAQDEVPIRDNSFFIEEAFNQEKGVVQHISNLLVNSHFSNFAFSFTQEWPIRSEKNQLSYTIPYLFSGSYSHFGDILINYRYQLLEQNHMYLAPRISLVLPTGYREDGNANRGIQINLPFSYEWKDELAFHLNFGTTQVWRNKNDSIRNTFILNYGGSVIWLINSHINLMSEIVYYDLYNGSADHYSREQSLIFNPGLRGAINFKNGLQIVPGFSTWFDVINHENGFFFYLSFEHPF